MSETYDLVVIGGGINGAGIARDAAGRGLKVLLLEKDDLAQHTSSASTKLIHGGLRYLEQYEFRLVRESLTEREVLLKAAPHIIWPMRFTLPHHKGLRPAWLLRLGLFLYDHIGGRKILPKASTVSLAGGPLKSEFRLGFEYSDCWVEDARLVVLNAVDAQARGATIYTRTPVKALGRTSDGASWTLTLGGQHDGRLVDARAVVNAAGPWVDQVLAKSGATNTPAKVRLIKGSHIVVRRRFEGGRAYIFQNTDGRIVFAIPYENDFTLIGTTDVPARLDDGPPTISEDETDYLLKLVNGYVRQPVSRDDIIWSYSGVRPLFDDEEQNASAVTRDYVLDIQAANGQAPLLSVFGGKITTYRRLAEEAVDTLARYIRMPKPAAWTENAALPGGNPSWAGKSFQSIVRGYQKKWPQLPSYLIYRLTRAYGTRINTLLDGIETTRDLGAHIGGGLYAREVDYLMDNEFAQTADDILWRRSKLGLHMTPSEREKLANWLIATAPDRATPAKTPKQQA